MSHSFEEYTTLSPEHLDYIRSHPPSIHTIQTMPDPDFAKPGKLTKQARKEIKQIASKLTPSFYAAFKYDSQNKRSIERFPVNHIKRLETAFVLAGKKGISDYIKKQTEIHKEANKAAQGFYKPKEVKGES